MSEEHKDESSDRVKSLEAKPGGKEDGTIVFLKASKDDNKDTK